MAAGLIGAKRQTVSNVVATLVEWDTIARTFTHQFSQFALQQSWWRQKGGGLIVYQLAKKPKNPTSGCLRCAEMQTYGSCTRPPPQDSRQRRRSAVWTAGSCCPNTGTVQLDTRPVGGRCPGPGPDRTLRLTCQHSPARRHTSSSLGGTESSTRTGTGPRHRSEAGGSPALARPVTHRFHINTFVLGLFESKGQSLQQSRYGNGAGRGWTENVERKETEDWRMWAGNLAAAPRGQEMGVIVFTSNHALFRVGDVVQGDVRPHVPAHLRLEGDSEGGRVGEDDIGVRPLAATVSSDCPHQQTGAAGSSGVDLRCTTKPRFLAGV